MTAARRGLLLVTVAVAAAWCLAAPVASASTGAGPEIFLVDHASFEDLMAMPVVAELATRGGAGLMALNSNVAAARDFGFRVPGPTGYLHIPVPASGPERSRALDLANARIEEEIRSSGDARVIVIVFSTTSSAEMVARKDDLHPIVVAVGSQLLPARSIFGVRRLPGTLTSDSTRRIGVVSEADLAPTIFHYGAGLLPGAEEGSVIRPVPDEPPPVELHERYLAMRRMSVPIQTAAGLYVTLAGLVCIAVVVFGRRVPTPLALIATGLAISVGPLAAALLEAGHLPSLTYATVVPFVVVATLILAGLVVLGAERGVLHPLYPLGAILLAVLVAESLLGWTAALTPFLGGSELDGGRFYGLPNVFIGLLLGASLYVAQRLTARAGFVLLLAAGLFAGLPFSGANLGGAVTLFGAAGLWFPLRRRGRLRWAELGFAAAVVVVGAAVVLVAHRLSPIPTHITNFEEHSGGLAGLWGTFVDRLGVGVRLIRRNPFALVPVAGVLATLAVVLRPPGPIAQTLARHRSLRDALLVLVLSSVLAYVANDSGPAACGLGFGMALGAMLYVSVAERTWKMDTE